MPDLVTVYTRIPPDLKARVEDYAAQTPERQTTHALAELIRKGLDYDAKWDADQQLRNQLEQVRNLVRGIDQWAELLDQRAEIEKSTFTVFRDQIRMLRRIVGDPNPVI
jgi:hypothetical protein